MNAHKSIADNTSVAWLRLQNGFYCFVDESKRLLRLVHIIIPLVGLLLLSQTTAIQAILTAAKPIDVAGRLHLRSDSGPETLDIISARGFKAELYLTSSYQPIAQQRQQASPYTLSVYHLINPSADPKRLNRYPVLMFHGLGGDAAQMVSNSQDSRPRRPRQSYNTEINYELDGDDNLAFMLANNNFDVWLVDARGTNLNNHQSSIDLDLNEAGRYWNFTLDEQALYDLPALIDFVLKQTQQTKLHYIGYSESTFFMFALLSWRPEYQDKLVSQTAMAPVTNPAHIRGMALALFSSVLALPNNVNGNFAPQPITDSVAVALRQACAVELVAHSVCDLTLRGLAGAGQTGHESSSSFYTTAFKSTSIKAVKHFLQLFLQKRFGMYDYGPEANQRQYGQFKPPSYRLEQIRGPPVILVRGQSDFLSTPEDQLMLMEELKNAPIFMDIVLPRYNHLDYLLSKSVLKDINLPVVRALTYLTQQLNNGQLITPVTSSSRMSYTTSDTATDNTISASSALLKNHQEPIKPVLVVEPNKKSRIEVKSHLTKNLIDSFTDLSSQMQRSSPMLAQTSLLKSSGLLQQQQQEQNQQAQWFQTKILQHIGRHLDLVNDKLTSLTDRLTSNQRL